METMQVEERGNLVRINGQPLEPPAIPLRGKSDSTSKLDHRFHDRTCWRLTFWP